MEHFIIWKNDCIIRPFLAVNIEKNVVIERKIIVEYIVR